MEKLVNAKTGPVTKYDKHHTEEDQRTFTSESMPAFITRRGEQHCKHITRQAHNEPKPFFFRRSHLTLAHFFGAVSGYLLLFSGRTSFFATHWKQHFEFYLFWKVTTFSTSLWRYALGARMGAPDIFIACIFIIIIIVELSLDLQNVYIHHVSSFLPYSISLQWLQPAFLDIFTLICRSDFFL